MFFPWWLLFPKSEEGQGLAEYSLTIVLIAIVAVAALALIGLALYGGETTGGTHTGLWGSAYDWLYCAFVSGSCPP